MRPRAPWSKPQEDVDGNLYPTASGTERAPLGREVTGSPAPRIPSHLSSSRFRSRLEWALLVAVCTQAAHARPAVGNYTGLMPKFCTPHEVTALTIDITVLKPSHEVERLVSGNDGPQACLRKNGSNEPPSHFCRSNIREQMRFPLLPVEGKRFQVLPLSGGTLRYVVLETDLLSFGCATYLKRTNEPNPGLHIVDLFQFYTKRHACSLLISEHLLQCRREYFHGFNLRSHCIALLPHFIYSLLNTLVTAFKSFTTKCQLVINGQCLKDEDANKNSTY